MKIKLTLVLLFTSIIIAQFASAQAAQAAQAAQTAEIKVDKPKPFDTYISFQSNLLWQQFININGADINNNPYGILIALNNSKGHGLMIGSGFTFNNTTINSNSDSKVIKNNVFAMRLGYDKKFYSFGKRWFPSIGIDGTLGFENQKITTTIFQSVPNNLVTTNNKTTLFIGPAVHAGLCFKITDKIMLGTEANFNLRIGTTNTEFISITPATKTTTSSSLADIGYNQPTALFITIKF